MKLSNDMINRLMVAGLTRAQAQSTAAEVAVNLFMPDEGRALMEEAKRQVDEMSKKARDLQLRVYEVSDTLAGIAEAKDKYGQITDEKAIQTIALYGALISINEKNGVHGEDAIRSAGYITYAYLGGQARSVIPWVGENDN